MKDSGCSIQLQTKSEVIKQARWQPLNIMSPCTVFSSVCLVFVEIAMSSTIPDECSGNLDSKFQSLAQGLETPGFGTLNIELEAAV
jgi:hypothetical protein